MPQGEGMHSACREARQRDGRVRWVHPTRTQLTAEIGGRRTNLEYHGSPGLFAGNLE